MQITEGLIGLSGGNTFIQKMIRFFTQSNFSHSFLTLFCLDQICVLETTSTIVKLSPFKHKETEPDWIELWKIKAHPEEIKLATLQTFQLYIGHRYGYESYLWFIYRRLCRIFNNEPLSIWKWASSGVTCTELTCFTLQNINSDFKTLFQKRDLNTISPEELRKIMISNPHLFEYLGWYKLPLT